MTRKFPGLLVPLCLASLLVPLTTFAEDWTQEAHDAQRTAYTAESPELPWQLLWTFNGPDSGGGVSCPDNDPTRGHCYDAPAEARTITGGDFVFVPAGSWGLYALNKTDGSVTWHVEEADFNATPAYENGYVYAGAANGTLYQFDASDGAVAGKYDAGAGINKAVLLAQGSAFVVSDDSRLHKVNTADMRGQWIYVAPENPPVGTSPAFSELHGLIVYATNDLYVHAVQDSDGTARWRVKPTPHEAGFPYEFDGFWPVIAEQHGIVFLRMRLDMNALYGPADKSKFYATNEENRQYLLENPDLKNLFALDLTDGSEAFVPAVGYGGVEDLVGYEPYLDIGTVPIIRVLPSGEEVAYQPFRSDQGDVLDFRGETHLGEMVLDDSTIPGLSAGDLRFIDYAGVMRITDEQTPISMANETILHAHWGASEAATIRDRSEQRGLTKAEPIITRTLPSVIRRIEACGTMDSLTHRSSCGMTLFDDGKYWPAPGWWVYWNVLDPPTPHRPAYSEGLLPRYTYVADGLIIVEGNGGDLFVLKHSGTPD